MKPLLNMSHRSSRYYAETTEERDSASSRSASRSNNSRRRRHKSRRLLASTRGCVRAADRPEPETAAKHDQPLVEEDK
jgi:hypothetical protein